MSNPQTAAMTYAEALDRTLAAGPDYLTEDLLHEVGRLLGGLSVGGFREDLIAHLAEIERGIVDQCHPWEYRPGRGGNDPEFYVSAELCDRIETAEDMAAAIWLERAKALMEPANMHERIAA